MTAPASGPAPTGFALIPAGSFSMGDQFGDVDPVIGMGDELPVHTVYVSAFYMARTPVTHSQWQEAYDWAVANGYSFNSPGVGKAADHPVVAVSWFDVVKWCNAASELAGLTPVYRTSGGGVYRTEWIDPTIAYGNNGYRLPTEAEWEKAARGGLQGKRFPWGNTISHDNANYWADGSRYDYDVSLYTELTYHPDYNDGTSPYTSPVGAFPANGYGLYGMAGNVWQWCNDRFASDYYGSSPSSDPTGPTSGWGRVLRGGSWHLDAINCRVSIRSPGAPFDRYSYWGFRLARSQ